MTLQVRRIAILCSDGECELPAVVVVRDGSPLCGGHGLDWLVDHRPSSDPPLVDSDRRTS